MPMRYMWLSSEGMWAVQGSAKGLWKGNQAVLDLEVALVQWTFLSMIVTIGWAWVLKKSWSIRPTQTKKVTDCKTDRFGLAVYWIVMNCGINSWKRDTQWQPYSTLCSLSPTAWSFSTEGRRWRPGQVFDGVCLLMTHIWECRMSSRWPVQGTHW